MILCFLERICASWWYNSTSTLILCNVSRLAYSSRLHLSFNTHLLNNIFWLLNFFIYNIFVYFGFGRQGFKVQRRFFSEWTWICANSTPRFKSIIGRKLPNAIFGQKKQYFAHFPKLIREMPLFWNSIFSKSSY